MLTLSLPLRASRRALKACRAIVASTKPEHNTEQVAAAIIRRGNPAARERIRIMQYAEVTQTSTLRLVLAWSIAGIPLLAGVAQTLVNAMKLFQ